MLTENDIQRLKAAKNETEWNAECDRIKRNNDGDYPGDWFPKVLMNSHQFPVLNQ